MNQPHLSESLRRLVRKRSRNRCEYCGLAQDGQEAVFHIDHVHPVSEGGLTVEANLALACVSCSLRKAARLSAADPETGRIVRIFNPREEVWTDHFRWEGTRILGITENGRATVDCMRMNRILILATREEEAARGRHPPPGSRPVGLISS